MPASVRLSIDTATIQRLLIEKLLARQADSDAAPGHNDDDPKNRDGEQPTERDAHRRRTT